MAAAPDPLAALVPHPPTADPFADTWYAYLSDPELGLLKVAFLTYLNDQTEGGRQHGYVHVVHAPADGGQAEYDHWFREVVSEPAPERGPGAFRFEVPDRVTIDDHRLALELPEVQLEIELTGAHEHWFPPPDATASPFVGPPASTPGASHWFVLSLGTPARYRLRTPAVTRAGEARLYVERGWSTGPAHGFCYLVGISDRARVVLVCGQPDDTTEVWAGRVMTGTHDLTFLPFAPGANVRSEIDPAAARVEVVIDDGDVEVGVSGRAPLDRFYDQITPSLTVFGADNPVAKTMQASMEVEVRASGDVVERVAFPQALLELGGTFYPTGLHADRPPYRYSV